jgi:hypothetical protein
MSDKARPRCLKGNLLNARDRLGETIIEIVAADVAAHGSEVIAALRKQNPVAYARLISDLVHFKKLSTERAPKKNPNKPQRKPREIRMKDLLKAMDEAPIDVNCAILPPHHRERWIKSMEALRPRTPWDLTPDELRAAWDADLAEWFEKSLRNRFGRHQQPPRRRNYRIFESIWELAPERDIRVRYYIRVRKPDVGREAQV